MTTTENAIAKLQAHAAALTGMNVTPATPLNSLMEYPYAITYARRGSLIQGSGGQAEHSGTLVTEIHCGNGLLPLVLPKAMSFGEPFMQRLINDPTLGGTIGTIQGVRYEFGRLGDTEEADLGYKFEIDIKFRLIGTS